MNTSPTQPDRPESDPQPKLQAVRTSPLVPLVIFISTLVIVLGSDLVMKYWSFEHVAGVPVILERGGTNMAYQIPDHAPMRVVPSVLSLRLTINNGAIFGIGHGAQKFFIGVSILATAFICYLFWRSPRQAYAIQICYALILAGALGNMYDRVVYNGVRDMFWLFPGVHLPFGWRWPGQHGSTDLYPWLFNIADVALIVGVMTLILLVHLADRRQQKSAKNSD